MATNHALWLNPDGTHRQSGPYWVFEEERLWSLGIHNAHVNAYYTDLGRERSRHFLPERNRHGSHAAALACLRNGGCVSKTLIFRNEWLRELDELRARSVVAIGGAGLVTPPLCPMGGTQPRKSIKKYTDYWRKNHAN